MRNEKVKGELEDHSIILSWESAEDVYSRLNIGEKIGDKVYLSPVEGMYLVDTGRIEIKDMKLCDLFKAFPDEGIKYLAYRDMKQRGLTVKPFSKPYDFSIYRNKGSPETDPSTSWVKVVSEQEPVCLTDLGRWVSGTQQARKRMTLSVVDEEGDVTYYEIRLIEMRGASPQVQKVRSEGRPDCLLINSRGVIFDKSAAVHLHTTFFFGRMIGDTLQLSPVEVVYLAKMGAVNPVLPDKRHIRIRELIRIMKKHDPESILRIRTYFALRAAGLIPKTGFKYGVYFRAYTHSPEEEHAPYLVHTVDRTTRYTWADVSRAVRLAHGVKKEMVFCRIDDEESPVFYQVSRVRI